MKKISIVSVSTETLKVEKKEFNIPVVVVNPITTEVEKKGNVVTNVSAGSLCFNKEALKGLNLGADSTITISETEAGLCIFNSTEIEIPSQLKKKLTKTGILRLSKRNVERIYSDNSLDLKEPWVFQVEECIADFPQEENVKIYLLNPLEKRA